MFCPKCGALMRQSEGRLACSRCGSTRDHDKADKMTVTEKMHTREMVVIEGDTNVLPITNEAECPKCGHREAYWILRQTRAADEPETRIYECTKCHARWREY
jgi:DNA-directed RNA polymerase subunit M